MTFYLHKIQKSS